MAEPIALEPGGDPVKADRPELSLIEVFRNVSDEPVRMLNLHTPGGFVQYRRELAELRTQGTEPDREWFESHDVYDA